MRAHATIVGWHLALVGAFICWVLTWPETVDGGGDIAFTMSRSAQAWLLAIFLLAPALCLSLAISLVVVALIGRRRRRSGLAAGTAAAITGAATVAVAVAILSLAN